MRRILIAHDGSAGADQAVDLVASMAWSAETALRIVTVIPDTREIRRRWAGLILDATLDLEGRLRAETTERLQLIAKRAKDAGVEQVVFDRAGHQYHGRIAAMADAARKAGLGL